MCHSLHRGAPIFAKNHILLCVCGNVSVGSDRACARKHAMVGIDAAAFEILTDGNCDVVEEVVANQVSSGIHHLPQWAICVQCCTNEWDKYP